MRIASLTLLTVCCRNWFKLCMFQVQANACVGNQKKIFTVAYCSAKEVHLESAMDTLQPPAHLKSRRQKEIWRRQQLENLKARKKAQDSQTPFRIAERSLQSKMRTEDQPPIIDFTNLDNNTPDVRSRIISVDLAHDLREICPLFGEIDTDQRRTTAYIYADIEGKDGLCDAAAKCIFLNFIRHRHDLHSQSVYGDGSAAINTSLSPQVYATT